MSARLSAIGRRGAMVILMLGLAAGAALAEQTPEQRQACLPDAKRICANALPDEGRAFDCIKAQPTKLSYGCRSALGLVPSATPGKQEAREQPARKQAPRKVERPRRSTVRRAYSLRTPARPYRVYRSLTPIERANAARLRRCQASTAYPGLCGYLGGLY